MKRLKNLSLVFTMVAVLSAGIGQLAMAGWNTCPAYDCNTLVTCDVIADPIGTCTLGGTTQWLYSVVDCRVDTCYHDELYTQ